MKPPLYVAVCEDTKSHADWLLALLAQSGFAPRCDAFSSGEALLAAFAPGKYDLIFLDIYMDGIKGVDAAAQIRKADRTVTLVFTTTSTAHTLESYRLKAAGYLEKPVKLEDVRELLTLVQAKRDSAAAITLLIEGASRRLPFAHILYFEQMNHAVVVHMPAKILRTSQTVKLKDIGPLLPDSFFCCHHSFIANLQYVRRVDKALKVFEMQNGDRVYIRHSSLSKAVRAYEDFLFRAARGSSL